MDDFDKLPPDLTWLPDGHVTEIVLSSLADGEAGIVAEDALSHIDGCDHCTTRLGAEALLSAHAGELLIGLTEPSPVPVKAKPTNDYAVKQTKAAVVVPAHGRAAWPTGAVLAALVLAAAGAAPSVFEVAPRLPGMLRDVGRVFLLVTRGAEVVVRSDAGTMLAWASSLVLLISGFVVSRSSRPRSSNGLAKEGGV